MKVEFEEFLHREGNPHCVCTSCSVERKKNFRDTLFQRGRVERAVSKVVAKAISEDDVLRTAAALGAMALVRRR